MLEQWKFFFPEKPAEIVCEEDKERRIFLAATGLLIFGMEGFGMIYFINSKKITI